MPFAQGALRACHRMQIVNRDGTRTNVVAKVSKDPSVDRKTYYNDVQAQACAKQWAMEFNDHDIPKMIDFVTAYVFELVDRPGRPLIGAEEFIEGVFEKHNNNVGSTIGGVHEERATPNAFSHFTWEASNRSLLVCDIQGVGDMYTDPQIHTVSGKGFGLGNLGQAGLNAFLTRHKCNSICEHLGLSLINTKDGAMETRGTPCRGQPPGNLARTGSRHNLELGVSGNSIGIKPYGGCADSAEGGAGAGSEAVSLGKAEEAVSPTPVLMTAPSNRAFKKDEQRLQGLHVCVRARARVCVRVCPCCTLRPHPACPSCVVPYSVPFFFHVSPCSPALNVFDGGSLLAPL